MFDTNEREKLINAIVYFVTNTKHCHTLKLFKLLNFLDFEHFRQTGFGVTGLTYKAWPQGPAPSELWHEMVHAPGEDLRQAVTVIPIHDDITDKLLRRDIKPTSQFKAEYFSKRELELLKMLAEVFEDTDGETMSSLSHFRKLPWHKVFAKGAGNGKPIPYELTRESEAVIGAIETLPEDEYQYRRAAFGG